MHDRVAEARRIEWADRHVRTCENQITEALIDEQIDICTEKVSCINKDFLQKMKQMKYIYP